MPRQLPPGLRDLLDTGHCESHSTLHIVLGDGTNLYFATAQIEIAGQLYLAEIRKTGALHMSLTRASDRVEISVQNVDRAMGETLTGPVDQLNGCTATFGRVFVDTNTGAKYHVVMMPGVITGARVDETAVAFSLISDVDAATQIAGWRPQTVGCPLQYKGIECGTTSPLPSCDFTFDGANGCDKHINTDGRDNTYRYGGFLYRDPKIIEQQAPAPIVPPPDDIAPPVRGGGGGGGGSGYTGDPDDPGGGYRRYMPIYYGT